MKVAFTKMQGTGNDFVLIDEWKKEFVPEKGKREFARKVSDRHFGVGADGVIFVSRSRAADAKMRFFNSDGSEAEMCGNGIRCFARYVHDKGYVKKNQMKVETRSGVMEPELRGGDLVRVKMAKPLLECKDETLILDTGEQVLFTSVGIGNPHVIVFVPDLETVELARLGPAIETHPRFSNGTNVHFVKVVSKKHLAVLHWERGVGATMSCGTGACATAVAAFACKGTEPVVTVAVPGGELKIEIAKNHTGWPADVFIEGPADYVYKGEVQL